MEVLRTLAATAIHFLAGVRQIRDVSRPQRESENESDRAGRLGELEVALLFQGVSGALVFQSLRVPDSERKGRREIDLVILTKKKIYVIEVKNWAGTVKIQRDGSWCQIRRNGTTHTLPDVVEDTKFRASLLEAYIARRGVKLPTDFIDYKVFLINPDCSPVDEILYQPEVLTSEQWQSFLDQEVSQESWFRSILTTLNGKDTTYEQLKYILSTAPTWDKLYLEGGRIVVGDFMYFRGRPEDMLALQNVKRSNTCYVEMQHVRSWLRNTIGFLFGMNMEVKLLCTARDVREVGGFLKRKHAQQVLEVRVRPDLEIVFRVVGSSKPESFLVNSVSGLSLSV
ncbi:uncharacterized protein LOC9658491 [Selaginella moellendorffii]|uniref:uncharacterized protein LOC9658491 n=1 Tax=Selaginella moellendorffii TaxID=88036 RepID=UPI000D1C7F08|nr:uncharacterized protein LOC9658491 [Selaginella moellendorffii]|eukprot:XP_002965126.2 uncharacterized protein LOC9658491 [Selaginella moellendorffii]